MRSGVILAVLALGCASPGATAPAAPPLPQPHPHAFLQRLVGTWVGDSDVYPASGGETVQMQGVAVARAVGSFVVMEGTVPIGDRTLTAVFAVGYDTHRRKFVGAWFDSVFTNLRVYEGELDAAGEVLTLEAEGPSPADPNARVYYREVLSFAGDDRRLHTAYVSQDGAAWTRTVAARSRRR